jgi:hypothetical protein
MTLEHQCRGVFSENCPAGRGTHVRLHLSQFLVFFDLSSLYTALGRMDPTRLSSHCYVSASCMETPAGLPRDETGWTRS